jgi:hypothetical protein
VRRPDGVIDDDISCVGVFDIFVVHGVLDSVLNIMYLFLFFRLLSQGRQSKQKIYIKKFNLYSSVRVYRLIDVYRTYVHRFTEEHKGHVALPGCTPYVHR